MNVTLIGSLVEIYLFLIFLKIYKKNYLYGHPSQFAPRTPGKHEHCPVNGSHPTPRLNPVRQVHSKKYIRTILTKNQLINLFNTSSQGNMNKTPFSDGLNLSYPYSNSTAQFLRKL